QAQTYQTHPLVFSKELTEQLNTFARRYRLTVNTIIQGCIGLLFSKYSRESDVIFGVTVAGRPGELAQNEQMVGLFINTLPLRIKITNNRRVLAWLEGIQNDMVQQNEVAYTPLIDIQRWSDLPAGANLFEYIYVFENYPLDESALAQLGDLKLDSFQGVYETNYPLAIVVLPRAEFAIHLTYDLSRFDPAAIEQMAGHLQTLLASLIARPNETVGDLPLLSETEQRQIVEEWNGTPTDYAGAQCVHQLFEAQVAAQPDKIALVFGDEELTYGELDGRANQLAHYLQSLGVGAEVLVGICVERSLEMVVGVLAVLKAGGAYLPLDPNYPTERLAFMVDDAAVSVLLSQGHLQDRLPETRARVVYVDKMEEQIAHYPVHNPINRAVAENLAYVIYTSGSTGQPKGALLAHRGACNLVQAQIRAFNVQAQHRVLQVASFSFDASFSEMMMALGAGASLHLATQDELMPGTALTEVLVTQRISHVTLVPTALAQLSPAELPELQTLIVAGEACPPKLAQTWAAEKTFLNAYGPTEA
ncbi:MAG: AMP-binding protein, partial [Caldilineaceae bacterium]|nr:AMP-binding protein [Caldilineaceae bacterium]